jgi:thioredoxin-dependent peroxiredoxin
MAFITPVSAVARAGLRTLATCPQSHSAFTAPQRPRLAPTRGHSMFGAGSATAAIGKGDRAPAFSAVDQSGKTVSLSDYLGKRAVALFFYPKDFTPGCTKQVCSFRDAVEEFEGLDCAILGVSAGSASEHSDFDEKFKLKFPLLVDSDNSMRKSFGVPSTFGLLPGRVTYVIDKEGIVREVYNSQLNVTEHVNVVRRTLTALAK